MIAACPFPWPRGTPIRIHRLAEALGRRGHEVHVLTYHFGEGALSADLTLHRIAGPSIYRHGAPGPTLTKLALLDPLLTYKLRRLMRALQFDVIHAHHYEGMLCAWLARCGGRTPPLVFDVHTLLGSELPAYSAFGQGLLRSLGRALDRALPRRADHLIAVSEEMRRSLGALTGLDESRITLISNGVETEHFGSGVASVERHTVVFAGNLAPYQGLESLLQAFALVRQLEPSARLRLLTDGDFSPWRASARMLGLLDNIEVRQVGYAQLPVELCRAGVLVNPRSVCSGIPQKLLNYMASGRPVVSFAGSAAIMEHERTGLIVRDEEVAAFAAAILRLMSDEALAMSIGARARAFVTEQYSWEQVAARVEQVYACLPGLRLLAPEIAADVPPSLS